MGTVDISLISSQRSGVQGRAEVVLGATVGKARTGDGADVPVSETGARASPTWARSPPGDRDSRGRRRSGCSYLLLMAGDEQLSIDAVTPTILRRAMSCFASGVTVVTGTDPDPDDEFDRAVGFACQSFASVSLEPPLVLFCADHRGRAWPRIRRSGRFCVNVLGEHQVDVCDRFGSARGAKFDGLDFDVSRWGTPALRDVLIRVHAEVFDVHVAGDHDVVIGRVLEIDVSEDLRPMIFFQGRFGVDDDASLPVDAWGWGDSWG